MSGSGHVCQFTEDYLLAVKGIGVPYNPDFNGAKQHGVGTMQYTTWQHRRHDAVDAFLAPLANDTRLTIRTCTTVVRILVEHGRAKGVKNRANNREETIHTDGDVLVAAGTYNLPNS